MARRSRKGEGGNTETAGAAYASVQALAAMIGRTAVSMDWIIDSGALHHLWHNRALFVTFKRLLKPVMVNLGDNSTVPAIAAVMIHLTLPSRGISIVALFVPQLQASLLSVSQLSITYRITFKNSVCFLEDWRLGLLADGVYRLIPHRAKTTLVNPITLPFQANSACLPSIDLWHQRLGQLSHQSLMILLSMSAYSRTTSTGSLPCDICIKAKHLRKVERQAALWATGPFELLHSDLCGPLSPESASGAPYFILYIEDFSRFT